MSDWKDKPLRLEQDNDGTEGLHLVLDGYDHSQDHGLRIYGPSDEQEAREFLQMVVALWNDTARA